MKLVIGLLFVSLFSLINVEGNDFGDVKEINKKDAEKYLNSIIEGEVQYIIFAPDSEIIEGAKTIKNAHYILLGNDAHDLIGNMEVVSRVEAKYSDTKAVIFIVVPIMKNIPTSGKELVFFVSESKLLLYIEGWRFLIDDASYQKIEKVLELNK